MATQLTASHADRLTWIIPGAKAKVISYAEAGRIRSITEVTIVRVLKRDVVVRFDGSATEERFNQTQGSYEPVDEPIGLQNDPKQSWNRAHRVLVPLGHRRLTIAEDQAYEADRGRGLRAALIKAERDIHSRTTATGREEMLVELEAAIAAYRNAPRS